MKSKFRKVAHIILMIACAIALIASIVCVVEYKSTTYETKIMEEMQ